MKNKILQFLLIIFCFPIALIAQSHDGMYFQGAARNANGNVLINTPINLRYSIHDSVANGAVVYQETFNTTTTAQGMFTVTIGKGTPVIGNFNTINWGKNDKFVQTEIATNGNNFVDMGTTQMMSVPYALYAKEAGIISSNKHYIGELFGGGVIFHLWNDSIGTQHGLIVALNDQNGSKWSNVNLPIGISTWDGLSNSNAIVSQNGHIGSAAKLCLDLVSNGQSDWYLPSIDELVLLSHNRFEVNKTISTINGASILSYGATYWSSTEIDYDEAWYLSFDYGNPYSFTKNLFYNVRAIRSF